MTAGALIRRPSDDGIDARQTPVRAGRTQEDTSRERLQGTLNPGSRIRVKSMNVGHHTES